MIDVSNLVFRYPGAPEPAIRGLSFKVKAGSIFGFLGPSGAGKSTVQNLLIRLLRPESGTVRYDGEDLQELGHDFFGRIGVSFEHPNLFPKLTGKENLTCFAGLYAGQHEDPDVLLDRLGLGADRDKPASAYSKGMKQRLVLARSLFHRPDFLFLDEPTSGLDPGTILAVIDLLEEQRKRGARILLTTHDMAVVDRLCDEVAFLHDGKIAAQGTPRELKLSLGERAVKVERRASGKLESEIFFIDQEEQRANLARVLASEGVETVHSQEATLAEIFVRLTGRGLS